MKFREFGTLKDENLEKRKVIKMAKLILKTSTLYNLNDGENLDLGKLKFNIAQFKIPQEMVVSKQGVNIKIEKEKNLNGEFVETGKYTLNFKVYDRSFIELVIQNGSTEIGNPITIVIEGQENIPNLDRFEEDEFIPISFNKLEIKPKKVLKKTFLGAGKGSADTWQYADIKIVAESYIIGEENGAKAK
ncbi:peptidase [Clostridium sporogenes]|nr:peptidase [Clostridium sporogenes]